MWALTPVLTKSKPYSVIRPRHDPVLDTEDNDFGFHEVHGISPWTRGVTSASVIVCYDDIRDVVRQNAVIDNRMER